MSAMAVGSGSIKVHPRGGGFDVWLMISPGRQMMVEFEF